MIGAQVDRLPVVARCWTRYACMTQRMARLRQVITIANTGHTYARAEAYSRYSKCQERWICALHRSSSCAVSALAPEYSSFNCTYTPLFYALVLCANRLGWGFTRLSAITSSPSLCLRSQHDAKSSAVHISSVSHCAAFAARADVCTEKA